MGASAFSSTYAEARERFLKAAEAAGAEIFTYCLSGNYEDDLALDVALLGPDAAPTVVISSGVHGVEGFPGSAIQLALLQSLTAQNSENTVRYVLIHAVNPFGFANLRRFNEDNVDLNRNFPGTSAAYAGAPAGYRKLNRFLNPPTPPSRLEFYRTKAVWNLLRFGRQAIKQSVAAGQYEFPMGIFFGGSGPCQSTEIIRDNCGAWIGNSEEVVHLDFHTGLGPYGTCKLLLSDSRNSEQFSWYASVFGEKDVEPMQVAGDKNATAYEASGVFGEWMKQRFASINYRFATPEFGTYGVVRVLGALRAENRAFHYCSTTSSEFVRAKAELLECFSPADSRWRDRVVETGLDIVAKATAAICR